MYRNIIILFIALMALCLEVHSYTNLRCYKCSSIFDSDCADKFNKSSKTKLIECSPANQQACGKIVYKAPLFGKVVINRDCVTANSIHEIKTACQTAMDDIMGGLIDSCTTCYTDKCNGAITASPRITHVILAAFGSLVFAFILYGNV